MWASCDDVFSKNFVEINQKFLSENPDYEASTCPTGLDVSRLNQQTLVDFALNGNVVERFIKFFDYSYVSHGILYSLIRADILRGCEVFGQTFFACDWVLDLYLALNRKVHLSSDGYTIFGVNGISRGPDQYKMSRIHPVEIVFPFFTFTRHVIKLVSRFTLTQKLRIFCILVKLNIIGPIGKVYSNIFFTYKRLTNSKGLL